MDNMQHYNNLKTPPSNALRTISFGALKGKNDINPAWRTEVLTSEFGPCGIGWKYEIVDRFTVPVPTSNELMVYVLVNLYIHDSETGKWSDAIPAWGGDFMIKKDKNGLHGNDEAMKMATTDALGKAAAQLGVAADVYRGLIDGQYDSKYAKRDYQSAYNDSQARGTQTYRQQAKPSQARAQAPYKETASGNEAILKAVATKAKRAGIVDADVKAVIAVKYAVEDETKLTREQCIDLCNNLVNYYNELKGVA